MSPRPRLTLPARLVFSVSLAGCASSSPTADAAVDVRDAHAGETLTDALADALTDLGGTTDVPGDVADDARMCTRNPFDPENMGFAVRCLARTLGKAHALPQPERLRGERRGDDARVAVGGVSVLAIVVIGHGGLDGAARTWHHDMAYKGRDPERIDHAKGDDRAAVVVVEHGEPVYPDEAPQREQRARMQSLARVGRDDLPVEEL